ncbi:unnamed protein product [marine sediment metagenome]|uniref:Uncharacterized protein n=1 Tax=marine sediment metagenome TaxID=412755 RepID=X1E8Q7_9ZZZZ
MVYTFVVTIGYQNVDRKFGVIRPAVKTITKLFRTKQEAEQFAEYWDSGRRRILWVSHNKYAKVISDYFDYIQE